MVASDDDALRITQDLRELSHDWPRDMAGTIREVLTFEDVASLEVLIAIVRERVGNRSYPSVMNP